LASWEAHLLARQLPGIWATADKYCCIETMNSPVPEFSTVISKARIILMKRKYIDGQTVE